MKSGFAYGVVTKILFHLLLKFKTFAKFKPSTIKKGSDARNYRVHLQHLSLLVITFLLSGAIAPLPALAQSITPALDGTGTLVTPDGDRLDISGGSLSGDGANLFHSFQQFGLTQGQVANFLATPQLQNILGRVVGGEPSVINGLIQVTGGSANLYLMNPVGILFGPTASLNVPASFTATTANGIGVGTDWFRGIGANYYSTLVGSPNGFASTTGQLGSLVNAGNLAVSPGQSLRLLGGTVVNTGTLTAPGGTITIAAVPQEQLVRITQSGSLLSLDLPLDTQTQLTANTVPLTPVSLPALLTGGNLTGATSLTVENGVVKLTSSGSAIPREAGIAIASGTVNAANPNAQGVGGQIQVLGNQVGLLGATLDASGSNGGGTVLIGGNYQGQGTEPKAQSTFVSPDSTIKANASALGDGGLVIVWADQTTRFYGNISAQGGSMGGNGGFVEVSGKEFLDFKGQVNTLAAHGNVGTLLLDPTNINVVASGGSASLIDVSAFSNPDTNSGSSDIDVALINNATSNVILQATGDIGFRAPVNISQSGIGLTAQAHGDIFLQADIATNGGNLDLIADFDNSGLGAIVDVTGISLTTQGGSINLQGGGALFDPSIDLEDVTINSGGGNITLTGINNSSYPGILIGYSSKSSISSGGGNITLTGTSLDGNGIFIQGVSSTPTLNSGGGNLTLTGNSVSTSSIFLEGASLASGGGDLSLTASGSTSFDFYAISVAINSGSGNLTLTTDSTDLSISNSFSGTGSLLIQPNSPNLGMVIGGIGAADATFLNGVELASFANGFRDITMGRADSSGTMTLAGNVTFNDPVTLRSPTGGGLISTSTFTLTGGTSVTLQAGDTISIGNGSQLLSGGAVKLTGDEINIASTASIQGTGILELQPTTSTLGITLGGTTDDSNLNLTTAELQTLSPNFSQITVGRIDGSGAISLSPFSFSSPVLIPGGSTLIGANQTTTWTITGSNAGNLSGFNSTLGFSNIGNLMGGTANDTFAFSSTGSVTGILDGGAGTDTLDYAATSSPVTVNLTANTATATGGINGIEGAIASSSSANTLIAPTSNTTFNLTGANTGNLNGNFTFSNFQNLTGGIGNDTFAFSSTGSVTGILDGGAGTDILD
ncbi:MAG: filamentous hemagglutinin N-terminal domain-containing protein, partial [Leptolyngbyaceae bacterium]|nr:filamentous hemagglutinin N-terminal domain-containing protein [Leptolyngbyaceae bacterium]